MNIHNTYLPLTYGFLSGITVFLGSYLLILIRKWIKRKLLGVLNAISGGILAYLALESGSPPAKYLESIARINSINQFLTAAIVTALAFFMVWYVLSSLENSLRKSSGRRFRGREIALIAAIALGIHNMGEGFAISSAFISNEIALMMLFTIGFAVHNATEGFAISSPLMHEEVGRIYVWVTILSIVAGLPTVIGGSFYYLGSSKLITSTLYTIATASIVYAMLNINLSAMSKLGGATRIFWLSLLLGIIIAMITESIVLLSFS